MHHYQAATIAADRSARRQATATRRRLLKRLRRQPGAPTVVDLRDAGPGPAEPAEAAAGREVHRVA